MRRLITAGLVIGLLGGTGISRAQDSTGSPAAMQRSAPAPAPPRPVVKKPKPLRTELSGGIRLNTNGWSLFMDKGWVREGGERESDLFYSLKIVQIEFSEVKHPKEMKQTNEIKTLYANDKPRPYIFGKAHNFYTLKLGYGFRRMIAGKPEPGTVSVHWMGVGGLSVGMLKPYYVDAYVPVGYGGVTREKIKYDDLYPSFLNERLVIGSSGFAKGLNELKIVPGLQAKTGLHFDFAGNKRTVLAAEVGLAAEFYVKAIEIMATQKAYPYHFNAFVSFQFGKRW
jgi:hypothetical protein